MKITPVVLCLAVAAFAGTARAEVDLAKLPPASSQKGLTFDKDVKPLLQASCIRCHGEREQKGGVRLDSLAAALKGGKEGKIIEVGKSEKSPLVISISQLDPETAMPPKRGGRRGPGGPGGQRREGGTNAPAGAPPARVQGQPGGSGTEGGPRPPGPGGPGGNREPAKPLTAEQVGLVRAWIDQGAK